MKIPEKFRFRSIRKNKRAGSPAVSMVIITAATVVLVLISGTYALQVLERQQAASEFDTTQRSFLAFDDAVRDIAFDRGGSRSVRFTTKYGTLALLPNNESMFINVEQYGFNHTVDVASVEYSIPSELVTFGQGYKKYILGDETTVVTSSGDRSGRVLTEQQSGLLSLALDYRVRITTEGPPITVNSQLVTYIDIVVIRMNTTNTHYLNGDYDLIARNVGISSTQYGPFNIDSPTSTTISVSIAGVTDEITVDLEPDLVIFNLLIADVMVHA
jgi:hypothetical protein